MSSIKNFLKPSIYDFPLLCQELRHIKGNEETWISLIIGGGTRKHVITNPKAVCSTDVLHPNWRFVRHSRMAQNLVLIHYGFRFSNLFWNCAFVSGIV